MGFFERLANRSRDANTLLCVGLDPIFERHAEGDLVDYNRSIIEATAPYAACFKPNIAFYEQFGLSGLRALQATLESVPPEIPVIGDIKRGDIGSTAEAYARAAFDFWSFGAVTLSGYFGRDAVDPFLEYDDRGVYVLCRTSNPSAAEFQGKDLDGGGKVFESMAIQATSWSPRVGLVVGATAPRELARVRELAPSAPLLVPGLGAQGGTAAEVVAAAGSAAGKILATASRSIYYAGEGPAFAEAAGYAARKLRDELREAVNQ
ncbi:MAG TPA: orotidine-5'-phosphate decarboxylase [Dehalococcoidia bacterium]|nr:orotidine-5'-phosphate decarboxylase [Dehalococcoidia bacterium]